MQGEVMMSRVFNLALALALGTSSLIAQKSQGQPKVTVFVASESVAQGFTDPSKERQDSIKDIEKKVRNSKVLSLVTKQEDALLLLEVVARETKREVNGWTALSGAAQNKSVLFVRMKVGDYSTEFSGTSGSKGMMTGYGDAANKVVQQVEKWAQANRDKLVNK
jgi:hypothetical protein